MPRALASGFGLMALSHHRPVCWARMATLRIGNVKAQLSGDEILSPSAGRAQTGPVAAPGGGA